MRMKLRKNVNLDGIPIELWRYLRARRDVCETIDRPL